MEHYELLPEQAQWHLYRCYSNERNIENKSSLKTTISSWNCVSNLGIYPPQFPSFIKQGHFISSQLENL